MSEFDKAKQFADEHDKQVDEGIEKAGGAASERVGHQDQIEKGVNEAQERTGSGDEVP